MPQQDSYSKKDLIKAGLQVQIESNAGLKSFISDQDYEKKGGVIINNPLKSYAQADIVLKVMAPSINEIKEACVVTINDALEGSKLVVFYSKSNQRISPRFLLSILLFENYASESCSGSGGPSPFSGS